MKKDDKSESEILRQKAEEQFKKKLIKTPSPLSEIEMVKLIHELEVHQIELELQNDELQRAKTVADVATSKYSDLYDFAPSGYLTLSKLGDIIELNLTSSKILGKERSKLMNMRFGLFLSTDTISIFNLFLDDVFESKSKQTCEVKLIKDGDSPTYLLLTGIVSKNEELCNVTMVDINERKLAEEVVRKIQIRFHNLVDSIDGIVWEADAQSFIFNYVSQKAKKLLGYEIEDWYQADFWVNHLYKDDKDYAIQYCISCTNKLQNHDFEYRFHKKSGEIIWLRDIVNVVEENGEPRWLRGIMIDITEFKHTESIIQKQNEQLKELNESKDKFFSIIAHDLKSPFQGFLSMTQIMAEAINDFSAEELTEFGTTLNKTANNVFDLLKNLLEWSRMQQGSMSFEPEKLSITNLISNNIRIISERSKQKGIEIINEVTEPIDIYVDENMINSVLLNLLTNSIKFSNRGSTVTVNADKTENDIVEISISDTGIGMEQNIVNKLFKVGEDVGRVGTDGEKSTGLGLLLCNEFVKKHGGKIWVESKLGKGSKFYFSLKVIK